MFLSGKAMLGREDGADYPMGADLYPFSAEYPVGALARDGLESAALIQKARVIVHVHRERARSYRGISMPALEGVGG
ncbi:hypothetical protein EMIT0P253_380014 [Pseudomonas sp. IT-P253]